ncbi:hypothetical protein [Sphingomonas oleivorans]|uniref:hypothetical protein n=1 Tax=Sphingomonas oleivorans TaxID=1735121 RepID=UPI001056F0FD|nr:hypothetical protein [Sphingomonas oleivorans]
MPVNSLLAILFQALPEGTETPLFLWVSDAYQNFDSLLRSGSESGEHTESGSNRFGQDADLG